MSMVVEDILQGAPNMPGRTSINTILNIRRVLNMPKFWIWQGFQYVSITRHFEYARTYLDRVLNISRVLNMPAGFRMWQVSEYATVTQGSKYATIWLNMSEFTIIGRVLNMSYIMYRDHSASWWVIIEKWGYSEPCQMYKVERFGKTIISFNYSI